MDRYRSHAAADSMRRARRTDRRVRQTQGRCRSAHMDVDRHGQRSCSGRTATPIGRESFRDETTSSAARTRANHQELARLIGCDQEGEPVSLQIATSDRLYSKRTGPSGAATLALKRHSWNQRSRQNAGAWRVNIPSDDPLATKKRARSGEEKSQSTGWFIASGTRAVHGPVAWDLAPIASNRS